MLLKNLWQGCRTTGRYVIVCGFLFTATAATPLTADEPSSHLIGGVPAQLPPPPEAAPRDQEEVKSFLDTLSTNDAAFKVPLGQGRMLTLQKDIAEQGKQAPVIAVGDPSVLDFQVVGPRQIRVVGLRVGVTDLTVTTPDFDTFSFEVHVLADLELLRAQLASAFPTASLKLAQIADHIIVEGQARDTQQVERIIETIEAWLSSVQAGQARRITSQRQSLQPNEAEPAVVLAPANPEEGRPLPVAITPLHEQLQISATIPQPKIINLIRIPGSQQVMLKVQVAELNRTGLRRLGASFLFNDGTTVAATAPAGSLPAFLGFGGASPTAIAGVIDGKFTYFVEALRRNSVLRILAEPNLVAYHGHEATFLAGGEFPIPVPQNVSGGSTTITVQFREFGVRLAFVPYILDNERIRLTVSPEVSSIDKALTGTILVAGGTPVPALSSRKMRTTVEMREGQTLAMAGLLQVTLDNQTNRIPGIGDLPVLGPFFSNNSGERVEKELIVMVTPYLVEGMDPQHVGPLPGSEINEPNDLEFYLLGRIESRVGEDFRSTTKWDNPCNFVEAMRLQRRYMCGPCGYATEEVCEPGR